MIPEENTLAEIVRKFPAAAPLFEIFDLDYCCHGKVTLKEACQDETKFRKVEHALHRMIENDWTHTDASNFESTPLHELIDHIETRHHAYVKGAMPVMMAHLEKIALKHGSRHPELLTIAKLFGEVREEFVHHMFKEEKILFPLIKELEQASGMNPPLEAGMLSVAGPIRMMEHEHENAGGKLHEIRMLTNNYQAPENACNTYQLSFVELRQFEHDLHQHVHLENNILFPKAILMQENFVRRKSN